MSISKVGSGRSGSEGHEAFVNEVLIARRKRFGFLVTRNGVRLFLVIRSK